MMNKTRPAFGSIVHDKFLEKLTQKERSTDLSELISQIENSKECGESLPKLESKMPTLVIIEDNGMKRKKGKNLIMRNFSQPVIVNYNGMTQEKSKSSLIIL